MMDDDTGVSAQDAYAEVAAGILQAMQVPGDIPGMPWSGLDRVPTNPITGRRFAGSNIVALWAAMRQNGYKSPYWASRRAWERRGGVIQDVPGTAVFMPLFDETHKTPYSKRMGPIGADPLDPTGNRLIGFRRWTVFNQDVVTGAQVAPPALPHPFTPVVAADKVLTGYLTHGGPALVYGGAVACYVPKFDRIHLPPREAFQPRGTLSSHQFFYAVALHECIHSTSSPNRLNRTLGTSFGSPDYAREELVAELGGAFVCARLGLSTEMRADHAGYIKSWMEVLKGKKGVGAFSWAVSQAGTAADYILAQAKWVETSES